MDWLVHTVGGELWARMVLAALIVVVFTMLSRVARALLNFLGHKVFSKTETVLDDKILEVLLVHVKPLMILVGFHLALEEVHKGASPSDLTLLQILEYGEALLYIAVAILALKILLGIIKVFIDWYLDKVSAEGTADLKNTLGPLTSKVMNILVGMVAVIIVLDHFGINIGSLLVSLGVGSLAVALAAQDTLANMIAGFVILVDRPFRVGDRIELSTGQIGDVRSIGLRSTKLMNFDTNVIIIPNAELVKSRITNYSYPHRQMQVLLRVGVAYGSDPAQVRSILLRIADEHPDVLKDPPPQVFFTAMLDSSIEFMLAVRSTDYAKRFAVETSLREKAYLAFKEAGIEIPFPQRVIYTKTGA